MARARNIKPGFYQNEDLAECSVWARYIFPGLWMMADREGRLEYRPKKIKGELLRFDNQDAEPLLRELEKHGFIAIYELNGQALIQILTFLKHQNPHHREANSELPTHQSLRLMPDGRYANSEASPASHEHKAPDNPEASPGQAQGIDGMEGGGSRADSLIPDSLIPDSGSSVVGTSASEPKKKPEHATDPSRATQIAVKLRAAGIQGANGFNPHITQWAENPKVTDAMIDELLALVAQRKPGEKVSVGYLATIMPDLLNPAPIKPPRAKRDDWDRTDSGTDRKARELKMTARAGEQYAQFRERIWTEIRKREHNGDGRKS